MYSTSVYRLAQGVTLLQQVSLLGGLQSTPLSLLCETSGDALMGAIVAVGTPDPLSAVAADLDDIVVGHLSTSLSEW